MILKVSVLQIMLNYFVLPYGSNTRMTALPFVYFGKIRMYHVSQKETGNIQAAVPLPKLICLQCFCFQGKQIPVLLTS